MKSSIFLTLGILAAVHSIPIVIIKNKGVNVGDATEQTNPITSDSTSEDEYPRIHPILPLPKKEVANPTSIDEYPQIHPKLPLTRDKASNFVNPATSAPPLKNKSPPVGLVSISNEDETPIIFKLQQTNPLTFDSTSEDEYPRIHPILPLPKKEEANPTSVDEYPQIHPILPLIRDKAPNPATSAPPLKNKSPSVGLVSISNEDETPLIFKLQPGLSYNQAPPKSQEYNKEPVMQYENMAHNQETFTNQGVNLQNNHPIPVRMNPEQISTQYQGQYNYSPADTNVGGNQYVQYQQANIPHYSYEYQNQYPQRVQQNNEYIVMVPAYNYYQRPYNNNGYNRPYYTQSRDDYRPQGTTYSGFSGLSRPFGEIGSRIQSAFQNLARPFFG